MLGKVKSSLNNQLVTPSFIKYCKLIEISENFRYFNEISTYKGKIYYLG